MLMGKPKPQRRQRDLGWLTLVFCSLHLVSWIVSLDGAGSLVLFWSHSIWEAEQLLGYS